MMNMRKITALFIAAVLAVSLSACGGNSGGNSGAIPAPAPISPASGGDSVNAPAVPPGPALDENKQDVMDIKYLDDFQQFGFVYEPILKEEQFKYFGGRMTFGILVSDSAKIYVGDQIFTYGIDLPAENPEDEYFFHTAIPEIQAGESFVVLDVGYDVKLPDVQMRLMAVVAKRFHDNPSAPFADTVPADLADAAAENNIFIGLVHSPVQDYELRFISLEKGTVVETYADGSQNICVESLSLYAENSEVNYCDMETQRGFDHTAWLALRENILSRQQPGNSFDAATLTWTFNDATNGALIDMMNLLNSPLS